MICIPWVWVIFTKAKILQTYNMLTSTVYSSMSVMHNKRYMLIADIHCMDSNLIPFK